MSRINTNVSSMLSQRILGQQNQVLEKSLERLGTGLRINRGADDPAGLIASESLRAEKASITAAIGNAERADQVVNVAEGGLTEISNLLIELESLVDTTANDTGLSVEEKEANQLQIDSILQSIDRIANSTSFEGIKLLNGAFDYTVSGANTDTHYDQIKVNAAKVPTSGSIRVGVTTITSAQTAVATISGAGGDLSMATTGTQKTATIEIAGNKGTQEFTLVSGTSLASAAAAMNNFKDVTGVSAVASTDNHLYMNSTEFGEDQFVSVKVVDGNNVLGIGTDGGAEAAAAEGSLLKDEGRDVVATVNGTLATAKGLNVKVSTANLDLELDLDNTNMNSTGDTDAFDITGGGAKFQISPKLDLSGSVSLGLPSLTAANLGNNTDGTLSLLRSGGSSNVVNGDLSAAQTIVRAAIKDVSTLRGRLGAFQKNTIGASIRSLGVALENTSAAESQIRDTDFAAETASLTRSQILVSAATNVLALANQQPQNVLQLLG